MRHALPMLCVLLLLIAVRSADVQSSTSLKSDQLYAAPTKLDRIGRIVAPVMINGKGPFRLVLDTGASHSTISPALAQLLGLTPEAEPGMWVNGITGTALLPSVSIDRLEVGHLAVENSRMPVVWGSVMANTDGILGVASFKTERLFVDFKWNRVSIIEGGHRSAPRGFQRIPFKRLDDGLIVVPARVGGVQVKAVIDTGAQRTRDTDRKRILEEELAAEEKRLADLKKEFNNGEPERQGGERNYQTYLDRTERLKADVARSEANVDSLRRELGSIKN